MKLVAKTDIGNQRAENQDSYRAGNRVDGTVWAVVCDGMGGARGGRLASTLATACLEEAFTTGIAAVNSNTSARALIQTAIYRANDLIFDKAKATPAARGMGTTVVCAIVRAGMVEYAHVGDSRAYLYHGHTLSQLTRDHSMVQQLVEQGTITEEEANNHPRKNLITRALGVGPEVEPDCGEIPMSPGDILLLCTDGLSNYLTVDEIERIIGTTQFYQAADALVQQALQEGGLDNITVLLVKAEAGEENNG